MGLDPTDAEEIARRLEAGADAEQIVRELIGQRDPGVDASGTAVTYRTLRDDGLSAVGLVVAFLIAGGLAACIALLYQGMALIMVTEGGFVASGGPYAIAHPAPDWIWMLPLSIMSMMAFGGLSVWFSMRGWGVNPVLFAWSGLFISLGWNFIRYGIVSPPEQMESVWGWAVCGVLFWIMGFGPAFMIVGAFRNAYTRLIDRQTAAAVRMAYTAPAIGKTHGAYIAAQLIGVAAGIAGAIALFNAVAYG